MTGRVTIPVRLISEANARGHWAAKARRATKGRQQGRLAVQILRAHNYPVADARIVTLTRIAPRRLDDDNLRGAFKFVRDGIADALGINDGSYAVEWMYDQKPGKYAVEVVLA